MNSPTNAEVDAWIVQKASEYIRQRFSDDFDLAFEKDDPDFLGFLDGMVGFLCMMGNDGQPTVPNCQFVPPDLRAPRLKPLFDNWGKGNEPLALDGLPAQLRKHFPTVPHVFDPEKKAFCVQLQLMDAHAELISQLMGPSFMPDFSKPDAGSFCYFIPPSLQAKTNYLEWVECFEHCVFEQNLNVGRFRQLDLKRKASTTSELETVLEAIVERQCADAKQPKQSKEAVFHQLRGIADRFTFFSNHTVLKAGQEIGVDYDGTNASGSCYGGKCLVLVGINDADIICLSAFWDEWLEC